MKKMISLMMVIIFVSLFLSSVAAAATMNNMRGDYYFLPSRNEYRLDYYGYPAGDGVRLTWLSDEGVTVSKDFDSTALTGIFYFTCGGTYDFYILRGGSVVSSIMGLTTSSIVNGSCNSYSSGFIKNDLGLDAVDNGSGFNLTWNPMPSATSYDIYKNGNLVGSTPNTYYDVDSAGSYTVAARNGSTVIGESDIQAREFTLKDCADLICKCIESLKPVLNQINQDTNGILNKMPELIAAVDAVKESVDLVREQLIPTVDYPIDTSSSYPDVKLENNKPLLHETGKFEDTNTYFTDQGDAAIPDALPVAPEPTTIWKDNMNNDIQKSPVSTKSPVMQRDPVVVPAPAVTRQPVLQKDTTQYELRWNSSQYNGG